MLLPQVTFDDDQQRFTTSDAETTDDLISGMSIPLSATFQLTRNCNFRCVQESERDRRMTTNGTALPLYSRLSMFWMVQLLGGAFLATGIRNF